MANIIGLLSNIVECKNLRHHLMKIEYIDLLIQLLCTEKDLFKTSYLAAGILSHISELMIKFRVVWLILMNLS